MRFHPAILFLAVCASCGGAAEVDTVLDITFDPCEPVVLDATGATAEQLAAIDDALAMWHSRGAIGPTRMEKASAPRIELRFEESAQMFHGLYNDELGIIYINSVMHERSQIAVTLAHELGHALGLWHVATSDRPSVMNPANLELAPNAGDQAAIEELWGRCPDSAAPDDAALP